MLTAIGISDEGVDWAALKAALAGRCYLIVVPVPWHMDDEGAIWVDMLWHRDLMAHLLYLSEVTVLAPRLPMDGFDGLRRIEPGLAGLHFEELPWGESLGAQMRALPAALVASWRAVGAADIVHSGVAGWPLPPGFWVNPIAVLRRRPMVIVVESAFWRLSGEGPHAAKARLRAAVTEGLARWSLRRAALAVFTHDGYRRSLLAEGGAGRALVTPASWIDESDVIALPDALVAWAAKPEGVRFLLPARLIVEKGIVVLLQALALAEAEGLALEVDVIGEGDLAADVAEAAARLRHVRLRLLPMVPYGAPFMSLLRGYHAVLVPSVTDEQPRILFDAFSQAVPVLASDTEGHRVQVSDGETGWRYAPGSPQEMLAVLRRAAAASTELQRMGMEARARVAGQTHQAMHLARARALAAL